MNKKIAVVLFNLGGPDCKNAIKPFLLNFFMDKNIITAPIPLRCIIASLIARKRSKREAGDSYGELGDRSPLLANSRAQAQALEAALAGGADEYKTFVCMRYWHPMAPQVVREVRDWGADKILLLPLYPQFSTTTSWSSLQVWKKALYQAGMSNIPSSMVCCYPWNEGFVKASAENIRLEYEKALADGYKDIRVLFSAHGLPEKVIKKGDPYQWQCEQSAAKIADALHDVILKTYRSEESHGTEKDPSAQALQDDNGFKLDWQICYQSRVGPMKWIGPSTEEALHKAAEDKKAVVIYPHAFTQEHVETLVELDIEYKEAAEKMGLHGYYRARTVGTHPDFIAGLAGLVRDHAGRGDIAAEGFEAICPSGSDRCCMRLKMDEMGNIKKAA